MYSMQLIRSVVCSVWPRIVAAHTRSLGWYKARDDLVHVCTLVYYSASKPCPLIYRTQVESASCICDYFGILKSNKVGFYC